MTVDLPLPFPFCFTSGWEAWPRLRGEGERAAHILALMLLVEIGDFVGELHTESGSNSSKSQNHWRAEGGTCEKYL